MAKIFIIIVSLTCKTSFLIKNVYSRIYVLISIDFWHSVMYQKDDCYLSELSRYSSYSLKFLLWLVTSLNNVGNKLMKSESEVTQSCPTLCDPMDCSLPGSSVHGIFKARVLEWVTMKENPIPWDCFYDYDKSLHTQVLNCSQHFAQNIPLLNICWVEVCVCVCVCVWLNGITNSTDMNLSKIWKMVKDREAWNAVVGHD